MSLFRKRSTLYILLISTIIMIVLMLLQGSPLKTPATAAGIVCLELAPTQMDADAVLDIWSEASAIEKDIIQIAISNTKIDFIFLLSYSLFLFTCSVQLAAKFKGNKILILNARAALAAGGLDCIENIAMLRTLSQQGSDTIAFLTAAAAYFKFILILIVIVVIVIGLIIKLSGKN